MSRRWLSSSFSSPDEDDELGDLRRQKTLQPVHALDLGDLLGDALLPSVLFQVARSAACACTWSCSSLMRSIECTRATSAV